MLRRHDETLRWGYCEGCRRWIFAGSWRRSRCPVCRTAVSVLEQAADDAFYVELEIPVPAGADEPVF
ncbi:hypothetical protein [Amycolatopsis sp. 3B14]|uniref:hypothetical protein n=1 Tax=Amycolatopsis sp. 3B14 TaxID=3243600 RepID=UPI003D96C1FC